MKAIHTTESTEIAVLLLKHIYTAHPPKVGTAPIISTITNDNIKDCLKKVNLHKITFLIKGICVLPFR